jgi:phospholipase/lecithinase/hemolysin
VVRGAICERPDRYLFWDGIHPTRAGHHIIARAAAHALIPVIARCDTEFNRSAGACVVATAGGRPE